MSRLYDRLDYVGVARYMVIDIYPHKKGIKISKDHPYIFDKNDVVNETAVKYYKSLYPNGIRLHKISDADETPTPNPVPEVDPKEVTDPVDPSSEDPIPEELAGDAEPDETSSGTETPDETPTPDPVENTEEENVENSGNEVEATEEEMIEYLDLNYDDESIKSVARDSGIKRINGNWDKATIIQRMIENNAQYIVNLMKNQ